MLKVSTSVTGVACAFVSLALMVVPTALHSQAAKPTVEEPQYVGQFEQIGPEGKLTPLEQTKPGVQSSAKGGLITTSSSTFFSVPNAASPVRVSPTAHFVVKASPAIEGMDPNGLVDLKLFVIQKDKRTLPIASSKGVIFGKVNSTTPTGAPIPITFTKYGTSSLEVVPAQPLAPGEYAFGGSGLAGNVFCFGVDAK